MSAPNIISYLYTGTNQDGACILGVLAAKALTRPGARDGLRFYLSPDWAAFAAHPWRAVFGAMGQAFFTLSVGVGCMTIFGSYVGRERSLASETAWIIAIDTFVALISGLVVFPACASYGLDVTSAEIRVSSFQLLSRKGDAAPAPRAAQSLEPQLTDLPF